MWLAGDSGDGKTTLSFQFSGFEFTRTDYWAIDSIEEWSRTQTFLAKCWNHRHDIKDDDGKLIGNLAIGSFWIRALGAGYKDFLTEDFFRYLRGDNLAFVEGWLPDELQKAIEQLARERGWRVWVARRSK